MPIYRRDEDGTFMPFESTKPELERQLEEWIELSPHLLLEGEPIAIIGRQVTTAYGKALDLLAVDQQGATILIELKKGLPPRDIVAQALEYTAWVDSLGFDDLDEIAHGYAERRTLGDGGIELLYGRAFPDEAEVEEQEDEDEVAETAAANVTFNARQRIVVVAEDFPGEMEQTIRYLRGRLGVDIIAVRFGVHQLGDEVIIETDTVVGRESVAVAKSAPTRRTPWDHEQIRNKVNTPFLEGLVDGLERWIGQLPQGITVRHNKGTHHSIYRGNDHLGGYYFAQKHVRFWLGSRVPIDDEQLAKLSNQASVYRKPKRVAGNVTIESDLPVFETLLQERLRQYTK